MKHITLLAASLALGATTAVAQPTDIPPLKCEPKPQLPGSKMMEEPSVRRRFERDMKAYGDCVKAYVAERHAAAKSHQEAAKANAEAGNVAVAEYNAFVKQTNEAAK